MPESNQKLLLVEDNPGDARLLREMLNEQARQHTVVTHVTCMVDAENHLAAHAMDIILLDPGLPDSEGLGSIRRIHTSAPRVPLVVLTGLDDDSLAMQALQEGAQHYLVKGQIDARGLQRALRYATERKAMEDALFAEKERAQVTLNSIADAVICTDAGGSITFMNVVAERLTGWSFRETTDRPLSEIFQTVGNRFSSIPPDPAGGRTRSIRPLSSRVLVRRDGVEIPIEDSLASIHDREGRVSGTVLVFRDVSSARTMALQMLHSAQHDGLTGLPNRALLDERIAQAIVLAQRHTKHLAVLFLDLDGFKHINDSLGHPVGDKLLQSIAKRLSDCGRASDTVCRQGGDEFIVLLSEVRRPEDAGLAASRILQTVADAHPVDGRDLHVTTSIGVSIYPGDGEDAAALIKNADTAMYQAKENRRHSYQYFKPAMNARAVERQAIEEGLRRALERHELGLHYQPKIELATGRIVGAEALIRWTHPTRDSVAPALFIPVAEDSGLILSIGTWVLRRACEQARAWLDAGLPLTTMSVNVSALEFQNAGFLDGLMTILRDTDLDPRLLELELTESVLMKHAESAASILLALREHGVGIAIDDFGTGYSSLSYLQKFPVDALKIDQSFVGRIATRDDDASIVSAVISMARSLKLRVIAEGVETREQLAFLQALDCDEAQGFYFSRPLPAQDFAKLLRVGSHSIRPCA